MISLRSKLTQSILLFFFENPMEERYLSEIARILEVDTKNLHQKLRELEKIGLFVSKTKGKERYYSINGQWPLYFEYKSIITKTLGIPFIIAENLRTIRYIQGVYLRKQNPFDLTQPIEIIIKQAPAPYERPSKLAILKQQKCIEKQLGRKITTSFTEKTPSTKGYIGVL